MEKFYIVDFAHTKARRITEILSENYDSADFEVDGKAIYKELQKRSEQEAKSCFIINTEAKFDEKVISDMDMIVFCRLRNPKSLKKMDIEEKLSLAIMFLTEDYLSENDRMFLF